VGFLIQNLNQGVDGAFAKLDRIDLGPRDAERVPFQLAVLVSPVTKKPKMMTELVVGCK
jgi:hypothetical protein